MWALVKANQVIKIFNGAQAFEHNDIKHPASIFSSWSAEEKAAIGLYPVQIDNSNYKDPTFFYMSRIVRKVVPWCSSDRPSRTGD